MNTYYLRDTDETALKSKLEELTGIKDYIGPIYKETGETTTGEDGIEYNVAAPITDTEGNTYYHANLYSSEELTIPDEISTPTSPARKLWI